MYIKFLEVRISRRKSDGSLKIHFAKDMTGEENTPDTLLAVVLDEPMTRADAAKFLLTTEAGKNPEVTAMLNATYERYINTDSSRSVTLKAKTVKVSKKDLKADPAATMADLKARAAAVAQ